MPSIKREDLPLLRFTALTGMIGAPLFGALLVVLTLAQYDFLRSLHWAPLDPVDWPSGLALGPYGAWMSAGFIAGGLALMLFAAGLRRLFPGRQLAFYLFLTAGLAMLMLVFPTDPTYRNTPDTWHGILHDSAYVLLGLGFLPGMVVLALEFRLQEAWRPYTRVTWIALALILPSFVVKGVGFYVFLAVILGWFGLICLRIWQLTGSKKEPAT